MPEVNTLSVIILLKANKRDPACAPVSAVWYDEVEEIGGNEKEYQKGKKCP